MSKSIRFDGTSYNADWIAKHSESEFVAKCKTLYPGLNEAAVKELYAIAVPVPAEGKPTKPKK